MNRAVRDLVDRWRREASAYGRDGFEPGERMLLRVATELEEAVTAWETEPLPLRVAVTESGYSYSGLQKLLAERPDLNVGSDHRPRIRRCDLPRKAPEAGLRQLA